MRLSRIVTVVCLLLWGGAFQAFSQPKRVVLTQLADQLNAYTAQRPQAAIYLSTSKDGYEAGEDVWFKALVLDAQAHLPFTLDHTLYVRLAKADTDSTIWEAKCLLRKGVATGQLLLAPTLPAGAYRLSAYSAHSLSTTTTVLQAVKVLRVVHELPALASDKADPPPAAPTPSSPLQFTLLPEGGRLVAGLVNTVAFKAVDNTGAPVRVAGEVLLNNRPVTTFQSLHAGMGRFRFRPRTGGTYQIRLQRPASGQLYPLPPLQEQGVVLQVAPPARDTLLVRLAQSPGLAPQPVFLRVQVRGHVQVMAAGLLADSLLLKLPIAAAAQGIAEVTVFDQHLRPLAERLVYLHPDRLLTITATLAKATYQLREKVVLTIRTADQQGQPVPARLGVSIADKLYYNPREAKNLLTHYYLSTQLAGALYDPGYYFDRAHADRREALDVLLLTQGWRCYLWNEPHLQQVSAGKPVLSDSTKGQLVAGHPAKNQPPPRPHLLLAFRANERDKRSVLTDGRGRFALAPSDLVLGRRSYLKHFETGAAPYTVVLEDPFSRIRARTNSLAVDYPLPGVSRAQPPRELPVGRLSRGTIPLQEVQVTAKAGTGFRDKYLGQLDSLAKLEANTDFVLPNSNWLNVPLGARGAKPVEGHKYTVWVGPTPPTSVPFTFGSSDFKEIIYHYPTFTEEELLRKFQLTRLQGYEEPRAFYQPNYEAAAEPLPDYRNTLLWLPEVVTDEKGEATVTFFCSDISSVFRGAIEGIGPSALLGRQEVTFQVAP